MKRTLALPSIKNEMYRFEAREDGKTYWIVNGIESQSLYKPEAGESMEVQGICAEIKE